jgi:DNA-directed RNA polymerase subunit omega
LVDAGKATGLCFSQYNQTIEKRKIMIYPPLDELLKHADNKYTLAMVAAKRARQIIEAGHADDERPGKAVTLAFEEIVSGKTKYESTKTGIK